MKLASRQKQKWARPYRYAHANEPCFSGFTCSSQTYRGISLTSKDIKDFDLPISIRWINEIRPTMKEFRGKWSIQKCWDQRSILFNYQFNPALKLTAFYMDVNMAKPWLEPYINTKLMTPPLPITLLSQPRWRTSKSWHNDLYHAHFELKHQNHKFEPSNITATPLFRIWLEVNPYWYMAGRVFKRKRKSLCYEYDFKDYVPGLRFMTRQVTIFMHLT